MEFHSLYFVYCSIVWCFAGRGERGDEIGVFARGASKIDRGAKAFDVSLEKGLGIEPKTRENERVEETVGIEAAFDESAVA